MPSRVPTHRPGNVPTAQVVYGLTARRREANRFYASAAWRKLRAAYLREHPLCADCRAQGRLTAAAHVHHKLARGDHPHLALEWSNLEALCPPCHNAKRSEASHDGP